jgi:acetyl esterase
MTKISAEAKSALAILDRISRLNPPATTLSDIVAAVRATDSRIAMLQGTTRSLYSKTDYGVQGGACPFTMRFYRPQAGTLPVILFLHGGAFISGTVAAYDVALSVIAERTGWAVVSPEYRLSPEHKYPAAPEDCYSALVDLASRATHFGIDPSRIVVAGESAGGLLAASVALMADDRGGPNVAGMICVNAAFNALSLDHVETYPSLEEHNGKVVTMEGLAAALNLYIPDIGSRSHPYASPALASNLVSLPPSLIVTTECDPLRDDGIAFSNQLHAAKVRVESTCLEGAVHGVMAMIGLMPQAGEILVSHIDRFLRTLDD